MGGVGVGIDSSVPITMASMTNVARQRNIIIDSSELFLGSFIFK